MNNDRNPDDKNTGTLVDKFIIDESPHLAKVSTSKLDTNQFFLSPRAIDEINSRNLILSPNVMLPCENERSLRRAFSDFSEKQ